MKLKDECYTSNSLYQKLQIISMLMVDLRNFQPGENAMESSNEARQQLKVFRSHVLSRFLLETQSNVKPMI